MPKLVGVRERIHQPIYDTLVRGIGQSTISNLKQLFGNANVGDRDLTNLAVAGQLASDQTFVVKAIRVAMYFQSLNDTEFGAYGDLSAISTNATSTNSRAEDLYKLMAYGSYLKFTVGEKDQFFAPLWYFPAGGGISGGSNENSRHALSNGLPTQEAIMLLAKDVHVPARQNLAVTIEFFPFKVLGEGQGGTIATNLSPLDYLNEFDGAKLVQVILDGVRTRDVQ